MTCFVFTMQSGKNIKPYNLRFVQFAIFAILSPMCLAHLIAPQKCPDDFMKSISMKAADLVRRVYERIDPAKQTDYHTHIAGVGAGGTGAFVNARMLRWKFPFHRVKFEVYRRACGVTIEKQTDQQMLDRLAELVRANPFSGKHRLLGFDKNYHPDGSVNLEKTEFHVPNDYVFSLAERNPDIFLPTISVHPYRKDAILELEKWASQGARIVKWLPNAMGIDPSNSTCDPFYSKMKQLGMILLSHGGEEKAVESDEDQKLGNPILLRKALDHGVKVIVAHCAGLGMNEDLDDPAKRKAHNFDLFLRLMDEPRYQGLVFGEISAMTQFNRVGRPLTTILQREDLHERLVNGSDYPLPAINFLILTKPLVKGGYITNEERILLKEIYRANPLIFDFVLKRCLKAPGTRKAFPDSVFHAHPEL
jgi:predicted TIM-barrel fold metal-dependent hydrolase